MYYTNSDASLTSPERPVSDSPSNTNKSTSSLTTSTINQMQEKKHKLISNKILGVIMGSVIVAIALTSGIIIILVFTASKKNKICKLQLLYRNIVIIHNKQLL